MENKNTESLVEIKGKENENKEKNSLKKKTNLDFWYGFSLPGRILITLYSLHGLFFIYNLVISYIIFIQTLLKNTQKLQFLFLVLCILHLHYIHQIY